MWFIDFGDVVWADTPEGDLRGFRTIGGFASYFEAAEFLSRYPCFPDARCHYMESAADFAAAAPRL